MRPRPPAPHGGGVAEPPIRLLIVDDSSVARAVLSRMATAQPDFQVVATAGSVAEALDILPRVSVDIILLDIEMPGATGLEGLPDILRAGAGARVLIVSSLAEEGAETTVRALALGAADTLPKPGSGSITGRFADLLAERIRRIGRASRTDPGAAIAMAPALRADQDWQPACIAVGASTGGIHALNAFLAGLPRLGLPILVTQHLPPLFMPFFAQQLAAASKRRAFVVKEGDELEPDALHVAPGTAHMSLQRVAGRISIHLVHEPAPSGCMPSVDPMLAGLGEVFGAGGVAVMLSGMGKDGLIGSGRLVAAGGVVLAQDQASCAVWGMPRAVADAGLASAILPPRDLARRIAAHCEMPTWK